MARPALVVFDLDRTLWPWRLDSELQSPFLLSEDGGGSVVDWRGVEVAPFPEVPATLRRLVECGFSLAVASRISDVAGAFQLLRLLRLRDFFSHVEVYPTCKTRHLRQLALHSGLPPASMLLLDDDPRNLRAATRVGAHAHQVPPHEGVSWALVSDALAAFTLSHPQ